MAPLEEVLSTTRDNQNHMQCKEVNVFPIIAHSKRLTQERVLMGTDVRL